MKNSSDAIGNRTRDLQFVAQCLNQLHHLVPRRKQETCQMLEQINSKPFRFRVEILRAYILRDFLLLRFIVKISLTFFFWLYSFIIGQTFKTAPKWDIFYKSLKIKR